MSILSFAIFVQIRNLTNREEVGDVQPLTRVTLIYAEVTSHELESEHPQLLSDWSSSLFGRK